MIVKIHDAHGKKIIALADADLLGKKFRDGMLQLDLTGDFYRGEEMSEEDVRGAVEDGYLLNIVGKESVEFAEREGWVEKEYVVVIAGIPHAQVLMI